MDAIAARSDREISVMICNYHDDDLPGPDAPVTLAISGLPDVPRVLMHHYRIDSQHSNSYIVWKEMGSPQNPTAAQKARLEAAGNLALLNSPSWEWTEAGTTVISFSLPRQAVSLVQLSW